MTNKDIAKAWFAAMDKKDFAAIKKLMASDHQFYNPMTPQPLGPDQHIGMMQQMVSAFSGEHKLTLLIEDGSHVAVRGRWVGTHTGEFNGVPATHKPVDFTWTDIMEIKDGKVAREAFEMNPMTFMAQIGAARAA
jgi:steroid delta-isomerase-like uncharacterized protein